jgi:hypothetical protein
MMADYSKEYLYLAWFPGMPRPIKIGRTWNPKVRMYQLQRQCGTEGKIIAYVNNSCFKGGQINRKRIIESQLHTKLSEQFNEKRSEWYPFNTEIIQMFFNLEGAQIKEWRSYEEDNSGTH